MAIDLVLLIDDSADVSDFLRLASLATQATALVSSYVGLLFTERAKQMWKALIDSQSFSNLNAHALDVVDSRMLSNAILLLKSDRAVVTSIGSVDFEALTIVASSVPRYGYHIGSFPVDTEVDASIILSMDILGRIGDVPIGTTVQATLSSLVSKISLMRPNRLPGIEQNIELIGRDEARFDGAAIPDKKIILSIVIPTLDVTSERFVRLYSSLKKYTKVAYQIIVVDNGKFPQGYTDPVNTAIRGASTKFVAVINDDVRVTEGWWEPLQNQLELGSSIVFPATDTGTRLDFAAWCFAFIKDELLDRLDSNDIFDPRYRIWYQDTDLLLRLVDLGTPPVYVHQSLIAHETSSTVATNDPVLSQWIGTVISSDANIFDSKWKRRQSIVGH